MKLTEMKELLGTREIRLTKSLGQNFLHDANQLNRIIKAAALHASDQVLEIGPGLGPLTQLLLEKVPNVLAIEKDPRLYEFLRKRFEHKCNLTLVLADALEYIRDANDWSDWKLVSNLPYSIASPILVEFALMRLAPKRMVATLQIEVAKRIMASAGANDYGVLTLLIQAQYSPADWFKIPSTCFFPAPKVDSACLTLVRRTDPLLQSKEMPAFVKIVKRSFSQRRKVMLKLLRHDWSDADLADAYKELQLSPQVRAEALSLEQFARLTQLLHSRKNK